LRSIGGLASEFWVFAEKAKTEINIASGAENVLRMEVLRSQILLVSLSTDEQKQNPAIARRRNVAIVAPSAPIKKPLKLRNAP
jgi:hypothetical protein